MMTLADLFFTSLWATIVMLVCFVAATLIIVFLVVVIITLIISIPSHILSKITQTTRTKTQV